MEQRLAEFRAARKRARLLVEPSTSSQNAQTSGEKAEAATTPKADSGWLKRFLLWKPRPTSVRALPSPAKECEIIELDAEKLNLEKAYIIKTPRADGLTKGNPWLPSQAYPTPAPLRHLAPWFTVLTPVTPHLQPVAQEVVQPGSSTTRPPPQHTAIPPPSLWDQSVVTKITFLKVLLWLVLLGLFVELEFGLAYFVLSLFYWMYVGTRSPEEKKEGEKSAYSVFNPGCEAIQGTLTAEQLERELQFRPLEGR
ncbi:hypothetical protein MC885_012578 [Smutsia gigantea]|nr:hypothetical protein MC885_012578 [Smutsia gigantea]